MTLKQIVYSSQPFGFDAATLGNLLVNARHNNRRDGLTGALVCRRDIYLQLLEGPPPQVDQTMSRIRGDDRHLEIMLRVERTVTRRLFDGWDMLHDPARSWIYSEAEIDGGILDRVPPADIMGIFGALADAAEATTPQ